MTAHDNGSNSKVQASPLYSQLMRVFYDCIQRKEWMMGKSIPSEVELARMYHVSIGTTRKALEELEKAGWIVRRQGRGSFVSSPTSKISERLHKVVLKDRKTSIYCANSQILHDSQSGRPTAFECDEMGLGQEEIVHRVTVKHRITEFVALVEHAVARIDCFDVSDGVKLASSLHETLLSSAIIPIVNCTEQMTVVSAPQFIASAMALSDGPRLLRARMIISTAKGPSAIVDNYIDSRFAEVRLDLDTRQRHNGVKA